MQPLRLSTEAACTEACEAQARCGAVTHDVEGTAECRLYGACLTLAHGPTSSRVVHLTRQQPAPPAVAWEGAAVVIAHYRRPSARLQWLRRLSVGQVAFYCKMGSGAQDAQGAAATWRTVSQLVGTRLAYFRTLPNLGHDGGGREPHVYTSFMLEFYANLPPWIVFTQDDCSYAPSCPWLNPPWQRRLGEPRLWRAGGAEVPARPSAADCHCAYVTEQFFTPRQYGQYALIMMLRDGLFVPHARPPPRNISWPKMGIFATGGVDVRARPPRVWEALLRLHAVEGFCRGWAALSWAHALERLWFDLFDPAFVPAKGRPLAECWREAPRPRWDISWNKTAQHEWRVSSAAQLARVRARVHAS